MAILTATAAGISPQLPPVTSHGRFGGRQKLIGASHVQISPKLQPFDDGRMKLCMKSSFDRIRPIMRGNRMQSVSLTCSAALNATCVAAGVQTHRATQKAPTITNAPSKEVMKPPKLDDGGTGFPPRNDGGGGGGGGGGEPSSGGFFLFGFLLLLSYIKDLEEDGDLWELLDMTAVVGGFQSLLHKMRTICLTEVSDMTTVVRGLQSLLHKMPTSCLTASQS